MPGLERLTLPVRNEIGINKADGRNMHITDGRLPEVCTEHRIGNALGTLYENRFSVQIPNSNGVICYEDKNFGKLVARFWEIMKTVSKW